VISCKACSSTASDFARLESETTAAEESAAEEFKKFMFASEKDKALKETETKHKEGMKTDLLCHFESKVQS